MFAVELPDGRKYRVRFMHYMPHGNGAYTGTDCGVFLVNTNETAIAVALGETKLHPNDVNNYCRKTGRKLAFGRALGKLQLNKAEKKIFWDGFKAMQGGKW